MKISVVQRLKRTINKNMPEVLSFVSGRMTAFITDPSNSHVLKEFPVFVFHSVEPKSFELQLRYLSANGYQTIAADELEKSVKGNLNPGRTIALTFDDATWTFWTYAFPLLKKYGFKAILFVIPGLVPDEATRRTNLNDVWDGICPQAILKDHGPKQPLCTWQELEIMHKSGLIDIQSHSLSHSRISVSKQLIDFQSPFFDTDFYGNVNIPVSSLDNPAMPERKLRLGAPIFKSTPRLAGFPRFKESFDLLKNMIEYVDKHGSESFFSKKNWRRELMLLYKKWPTEKLGAYESPDEVKKAVYSEIFDAKMNLEKRFNNKQVRHLCYPWFSGSILADQTAVETGHTILYYGQNLNRRQANSLDGAFRIQRVSEEYLMRLPGNGRKSIASIWQERLKQFKNRP